MHTLQWFGCLVLPLGVRRCTRTVIGYSTEIYRPAHVDTNLSRLACTSPMADLTTAKAGVAGASTPTHSATAFAATALAALAATTAPLAPCPARDDDVNVRIGSRKLLQHDLIARPVTTSEATANLMREGNGLGRRTQLANFAEALSKPLLTRRSAIARRHRLDALVLVRASHLELREHADDVWASRHAKDCRRSLAHLDGAWRCTVGQDGKFVGGWLRTPVSIRTTVRQQLGDSFGETSSVTSNAIILLTNGIDAMEDGLIQHTTRQIYALDVPTSAGAARGTCC